MGVRHQVLQQVCSATPAFAPPFADHCLDADDRHNVRLRRSHPTHVGASWRWVPNWSGEAVQMSGLLFPDFAERMGHQCWKHCLVSALGVVSMARLGAAGQQCIQVFDGPFLLQNKYKAILARDTHLCILLLLQLVLLQ